MTDRTNYLTVTLEDDYRIDDAQTIIDAISMIKGVLNVKANIEECGDWAAKQQVKRELIDKLWKVLQ